MINLYTDLFVKLVLAAKRHKEKEDKEAADFHSFAYKLQDTHRPTPVEKTKPIEDTVEEIMHNPDVVKLKKELALVEELFYKLKEKGENIDYLMRLESRIFRLKQFLEDRTYY